MRAFFIAALVTLIATAASAQSPLELAPIVMAASGSTNKDAQSPSETSQEAEIAILPLGMPADAGSAQPTPAADTTPPSVISKPVEKSSLRLQVEAAATRSLMGPRFICRGTEPFWVLRIEQTAISFDKAGEGVSQYATPEAAPSENSALAVTNFAAKNEKNELINALVVDTQMNGGVRCTDGIQDQEYSHSVFIIRNGEVFDGCCWMER